MLKGIIFDCDGMAVQSERWSGRYSKGSGVPMEKIGKFFSNEFQLCVTGKADLKEEISKYLKDWQWKGTVDELLADWFDETYNRVDVRFKELAEEYKRAGLKVYLATNNEKYRTEDLLNKKGLSIWFDKVFSSGYMGSKKPEKEFFQEIVDKSGFAKEELIFWDDDQENIDGANNFGLPAELYVSYEQFIESMKKCIANKRT